MDRLPTLNIPASLTETLVRQALDLGELEQVRLILRGNSVIDWHRTHFDTREQVDRFLNLHLIDVGEPADLRRLRFVHHEAVAYLQDHLGLQFPPDLREPADVRDVFIMAGQTGGFRRRQILACVILKLMHVLNHMQAAELRFQTPLSEAELMDLAERRISATGAQMREAGLPVVSFYGSRKSRNSMITKLLAKKENTAAPIFDKLRFRLILEKREHLLPAIAWMSQHMFPMNAIIPGQSYNNLIHLGELLRRPAYAGLREQLQDWSDVEDSFNPEDNPFSGGTYRMVNFIIDYPVRVDHIVEPRFETMLGRTVFVLVEFQVLDRATALANEEGENAHSLYKERQRVIVAQRLRKGARYKRSRGDGH